MRSKQLPATGSVLLLLVLPAAGQLVLTAKRHPPEASVAVRHTGRWGGGRRGQDRRFRFLPGNVAKNESVGQTFRAPRTFVADQVVLFLKTLSEKAVGQEVTIDLWALPGPEMPPHDEGQLLVSSKGAGLKEDWRGRYVTFDFDGAVTLKEGRYYGFLVNFAHPVADARVGFWSDDGRAGSAYEDGADWRTEDHDRRPGSPNSGIPPRHGNGFGDDGADLEFFIVAARAHEELSLGPGGKSTPAPPAADDAQTDSAAAEGSWTGPAGDDRSPEPIAPGEPEAEADQPPATKAPFDWSPVWTAGGILLTLVVIILGIYLAMRPGAEERG